MRLIGWGTLNDTPYWLIANSWGRYWGMGGAFCCLYLITPVVLKGYFMIRRGVNECGIEAGPVAGQVDGSQ